VNYLFLHAAREWSGTAHAFADAAVGLARRGHAVTIAVEPDSTVEQAISAVTGVAPSGRPLVAVEPLSLEGTWLGAARRLRALARRTGAGVVLVHTDREHLIAAAAAWLGSRARVIRRIPAGKRLELQRTGRIAAWLTRACYVFASERDMRESPVPRAGSTRVVAPLGIDVPPQDAFPPAPAPDEHVHIVCVHDASSRSRAATAVRTVAMLAPRHPLLRLQVIGETGYDDDLRMQAAALGALNLVTFLGDRADALQVMRRARLGWVVADGDTAAYGVLGFMSLGIPVIVGERSAADQYVLPEITGIAVPSDDAYLTAAAAAELLTNETRRETMGNAARARVAREYPMAAMIDGYERAAAAATAPRRR
jgi:glycosyltransferase involved in cell wall biosynthesis